MKKIIKYAGLFLILLSLNSLAKAQNSLQLTVGYNVNTPVGSFKDFISKTAYKGFSAELAYPVNNQLSVGLGISYNDFYQKYPRQVYDDGKGNTISAVVSNSVQTLPLLAKASYTLTKQGAVRPYVSGGAGINFVTYNQYLGEFGDARTVVKPSFNGDAGVLIPLSRISATALMIGGDFNITPFNEDGISNLNNWGLHAKIRIPLH